MTNARLATRQPVRICIFIGMGQRGPEAAPSATPAVHFLRRHGVAFGSHPYRYEDRGGTRVSAQALGVDEHVVVKTLVMQDDEQKPLIVLMHGDREVSTKQLARQIGTISVEPCPPAAAERHTGYMVGGTSPFGTRKPLRVFIERTILELDRVYVNGGRRGFLVSLAPAEIVRVLGATAVMRRFPERKPDSVRTEFGRLRASR